MFAVYESNKERLAAANAAYAEVNSADKSALAAEAEHLPKPVADTKQLKGKLRMEIGKLVGFTDLAVCIVRNQHQCIL